MADKQSILYNPILEPRKQYYSDKIFTKEQALKTTSETKDKTPQLTADKVKSETYNMVDVLKVMLPDQVAAAITESATKLVESIPDDAVEVPLEEMSYESEIVYEPEQEQEVQIVVSDILSTIVEYSKTADDFPELLPQPIDTNIVLKRPPHIGVILKKIYDTDKLKIVGDYVNNLGTVMAIHTGKLLAIKNECGLDDLHYLMMEYDGSAVNVPSSLQFASDLIVRSQIIREQKARLLRKTHNVDQTLYHIKAFDTSYELRKRYYEAQFLPEKSYVEADNNTALSAMRLQYDKKYFSSAYNLYKYLNSSVIIIDDIMNISVQEASAKALLLTNGVNIFAKN